MTFPRGVLETPADIAGLSRRSYRPPDPQYQRVIAVPPWYVEPIPTARNFFSYTRPNIAVPAGVGGQVQTTPEATGGTGGAFQIPASNVGVIKAVAIFCDAPTNLTDVVFQFRQNNSPIPGLDRVGFAPRNAANAQFNIPGTFLVGDGVLLDCLIINQNASGPWNVSVTITGWFNSPEDVYRFTGMHPSALV